MKLVRAFSLIMVLLTLTSCGVIATQNEEQFMATTPVSAWGEIPSGYEAAIMKNIKETLLDPESARFKFSKPSRTSASNDYLNEKNVAVWIVTVYVNAKNRFGGYAGNKERMYYLQWRVDGTLKIIPLEYDE
jgi:hypothetical protein